jgi:glucokinase
MILAGDIGGTKTLLGLFDCDSARPAQRATNEFRTLDYPGLPAMIDEFIGAQRPTPTIERAAFGVAGPVIDQVAEMTNVPWRVDAAEIKARFAFHQVRLLNDLESLAYSVPVLGADELQQLQAGGGRTDGNMSVIAAGTGLGVSLLHWLDGSYVPVPSEGGHSDFAARTDREIEFLKFLRRRYGRAEIEHVLSGPGLVNLSDFTHRTGRCAMLLAHGDKPDLAAEVTKSALAEACACCVEALDMFVAAYGSVAGNFALSAVSRAGVFIGGGIAPKILPALQRNTFLTAFNDKPPMSHLLEAMPIQVILNADAGLLGAAVYASQFAEE